MTKQEFNSTMLFEAIRVTEKAAIAAYSMIGRGDEKKADQLAVNAMRDMLSNMHIDGTVVIGEGERDKAPMLYVGERVGKGGIAVDIALDPLEGTTICATGGANSMTVLAITESGGLLNAPDVYMQKIAVGCVHDNLIIDLDDSPKKNLQRLAKVKGCKVEDLSVVILDRERHKEIISQVREAGARIKLIKDGDISAIIDTALPNTGIDMYLGIGGAPEGVLAAAALSTIGGQMMGRLLFDNESQKARARSMGIKDLNRKYEIQDMARKDDVIFAATGVTSGSLLRGVKKLPDGNLVTHSILMSSKYKTIHKIKTEHKDFC